MRFWPVWKRRLLERLVPAATMGLLVALADVAGLGGAAPSRVCDHGPEGWSTEGLGGLRSPSGAFNLRSESFQSGAEIPRKFTCEGSDASPALAWTEPPPGTRSLALIANDPDAPGGTWVHWVLYDLPAGARQLPEAVPPTEDVAGGGNQGTNDFGKIGYGGPCPPPGKPHRYFFKLYALDAKLNLKAGATQNDVERAMKGHLLAQAELMGRYHR